MYAFGVNTRRGRGNVVMIGAVEADGGGDPLEDDAVAGADAADYDADEDGTAR